KPPCYLKNYHCALFLNQPCPFPLAIQPIRYPLSQCLSYSHLSNTYKRFVLNASREPEPQTYHEAAQSKHWRRAMYEKIRALMDNETWAVTDLPPGKRSIGNKWVYKVKYKADESVDRYKAHLVARGYTQIHGVKFIDPFSPVAKINTVKTLLVVTAANDWHLHQMDVNNAFLHGELDEEV
ncbi:Retrovirus-related Pol polyprotein from transposon RE1, partial [Linum grandiflorum]